MPIGKITLEFKEEGISANVAFEEVSSRLTLLKLSVYALLKALEVDSKVEAAVLSEAIRENSWPDVVEKFSYDSLSHKQAELISSIENMLKDKTDAEVVEILKEALLNESGCKRN